MRQKDYKALAEELRRFIGTPSYEGLTYDIHVDEEGGEITVFPLGYGGRFHYVKEVVLFAEYHDLSVNSGMYNGLAALSLF